MVEQSRARSVPPLRIAVIAPPYFELPPEGYGGIEAVVADLVDGLVARGHDVTVVGAGRGKTTADFIGTLEEPASAVVGEVIPEVLHAISAAHVIDELVAGGGVDVVHDHTAAGPLLAQRWSRTPMVVTAHGPVRGSWKQYYRHISVDAHLVAISDAQRAFAPDLHWAGTVHNGVVPEAFPYQEAKEDFALWLGRYNADKAPHLAIDAARAAGLPIVLAGKCSEPPEQEFFAAEVEPRLGPDVTVAGAVGFAEKTDLLKRARCLLFPLQWDEPFGMVLIESMVCGTPVVALPRGAVPEVVVDGVTGILCSDLDQLPAALDEVRGLDPAACRRHVEEHFTVEATTRGYEEVYRAALLAADEPPAQPGLSTTPLPVARDLA